MFVYMSKANLFFSDNQICVGIFHYCSDSQTVTLISPA